MAGHLPNKISSIRYDKYFETSSGLDVRPDQKYFRFIVNDTQALTYPGAADLVMQFRVHRTYPGDHTPDIPPQDLTYQDDAVRSFIARCQLALDGNECEYHDYVHAWAK